MTIQALSLHKSPQNFTSEFCASLKETGFARIIDHGINTNEITRAYDQLRHLFALPLTIKESYALKDLGIRGYTGFGKEKAKDQKHGDLKEFWHIGKELSESNPYYGQIPQNIWPNELINFKIEFKQLFSALESLAHVLLSHISRGLNIDASYFPQLVNNGNSVLRLIHYPPVKNLDTHKQMRAAPHADINLMTLLLGATDSGLQLLDKNNEWQDVQTGPDEIVVDTGDMMALITGNTLPSTIHRVVNPQTNNNGKSRYSMPFFLHPHRHAMLECLPQFKLNEGRDKAIKNSITAEEFLQQRLRENGLKN